MDIVFNIVDNINPNSIILLTVTFLEKYNLSISKNIENVTVFLYDINNSEVFKFYGSGKGKKYLNIKKHILQLLKNISICYISGISSLENNEYLCKNFIISSNNLSIDIINIYKTFN